MQPISDLSRSPFTAIGATAIRTPAQQTTVSSDEFKQSSVDLKGKLHFEETAPANIPRAISLGEAEMRELLELKRILAAWVADDPEVKTGIPEFGEDRASAAREIERVYTTKSNDLCLDGWEWLTTLPPLTLLKITELTICSLHNLRVLPPLPDTLTHLNLPYTECALRTLPFTRSASLKIEGNSELRGALQLARDSINPKKSTIGELRTKFPETFDNIPWVLSNEGDSHQDSSQEVVCIRTEAGASGYNFCISSTEALANYIMTKIRLREPMVHPLSGKILDLKNDIIRV